MALSRYQKKEIKQIFLSTAVSALIGIAFGFFLYKFLLSNVPLPSLIIMSGLTGALICLTIMFFEFFIKIKMRTPPLYFTLFVKPLFYSVVILSVYLLLSILILHQNLRENLNYAAMTLIFSLIITFLIQSIQTLNLLLGQKAMVRLLVGVYHKPVKEKRFIMFLDLKSSTKTAEIIGDLPFHTFLSAFFADLTPAVLECRAEIYKYVGDEIILSWSEKKGLKNHNALRSFFLFQETIRDRHQYYRENFGIAPEFSASLHYGPVIAGELGEYKKEIALIGDTMNTAARIQNLCAEFNKIFLATKIAVDKFLKPEEVFDLTDVGSVEIRGKKGKQFLYSVEKIRDRIND